MYSCGKYTFGGIPKDEAWHWNEITRPMLGNVVRLIVSGLPQKRFQGYNGFFHLKRHFMIEEWDQYIGELGVYRKERNAKSVLELIEEIREQIVKISPTSYPEPVEPDSPVMIGDRSAPVKAQVSKEPVKNIVCEQLSLF